MHTRAILLLLTCLTCAPAAVVAAEQDLPKQITNLLGMRLILVPSGTFEMGSDESPQALAAAYPQYDQQRFLLLSDEAPVHRVRITNAFYLGQHEVTVGQFRRFLQLSGHQPESIQDGTGGYGYNRHYDPKQSERGDAFEGRLPLYSWQNPGFAQNDDHPVTNVSWNDAVAMANWLSQREQIRYRLPTEAEWEYAARAGSRSRYHGGDQPDSLLKTANTFDRDTALGWPQWQTFALAGHDGFDFTAPVGSFLPNAFGLYDMHGNVWEWCADWHQDDYYAKSPVDDPQGPDSGTVRVRRGGSWHTWSLYARAAYRNWNSPQTRYPLVGMRLVREAAVPGR